MAISACSSTESNNKEGTFGYDVQFLEKYTDVVVLNNEKSGGSILVTPKMQGRVMTSTLQGEEGKSLGWVNHDLISSGKTKEHFTPYGGEDRFWIAPEGGQYSIFIEPGKEMVFKNWYVPAAFNTEPWKLVDQSDSQVQVHKKMELTNYSGTKFNLDVDRTVRLLGNDKISQMLDVSIPSGINTVAYESENTMTNTGDKAWTKDTGALAIWILSQFKPAPGVTVVIPFKKGSEEELGSVVTTAYFGEISDERLQVKDGTIYFKMDGKKRRKLGVSPKRSLGIQGSYDETNNILTIMQYNQPDNETDYMNQLWKQQEHPYKGNAQFAYNDGPLEDGSQLGPFFEMESSSPAAFLAADESITHDHRIYHFSGTEEKLSQISEKVLGIDLESIKSAF